jgi:hypothetical protein
MTTYADAYSQLLTRKRTWTPVQPAPGVLHPGAEEAVLRALSLRTLELPVGEFIRDGLAKDVPNEARELLESNVIDEERHDLALNYVANVHQPGRVDELEAKHIIQRAVEDHPDHTVLKAMVLERSIFFVLLPMFRFLGDAGLRTVSADISRDEQVHVAANSLVCQQLGLTFSDSLDQLRKEIIQWVVEPLPVENENRYLSRNFWIQQSDNLMYTGKADGLSETRRARMPAFFEHSNQNLPAYA